MSSNPLSATAAAVNAAEAKALPPEPAPEFEPFDVYGADESGLNIALGGGSAWTTRATTLLPGQTLTVTRVIRDANADADGSCFLELDAEGQRARWGRIRFGRVGDSRHDEVIIAAAIRERDALQRERNFLVQANPRARRQVGAAARIDRHSERIAALTARIAGEEQG